MSTIGGSRCRGSGEPTCLGRPKDDRAATLASRRRANGGTNSMQSHPELALPGVVAEPPRSKKPIRKAIQRVLESRKHRQPFTVYRKFIQHHYDGLAGKLTRVSGLAVVRAILGGERDRSSCLHFPRLVDSVRKIF